MELKGKVCLVTGGTSGIGAMTALNLTQALNPLGSITGILIGTMFIFSGTNPSPAQIVAKKAARTYVAYLHSVSLVKRLYELQSPLLQHYEEDRHQDQYIDR